MAYQRQQPFTCPDAQNVWPRSRTDERARGGRRAGTRKAFQQQLGSGAPIRSMALVRPVTTPGAVHETDEFSGTTFGSAWSQLGALPQASVNNIGLTTGLIFGGAYSHNASAFEYKLHSIPSQMDTSGSWDLFFNCYVQSHTPTGIGVWSHDFWIRLSNASPDITQDGVRFRVITGHPSGAGTSIQQWTISEFVSGVETAISSGVISHPLSTNFTVNMTRAGTTSTFLINSTQVYTGTFTNSNSNQRFAFGLKANSVVTVSGGLQSAAIIDRMVFNYTGVSASEARADRLAAVSNGILHIESATGSMAAVSGSVSLRDDAQLRMQGRLDKLFIADYSAAPKANASNGTTNGSPGLTFDSSTYSDWTTLNIDVDEDVLVISGGTGVTAGTYAISSVSSGALTLAVTPGISASNIVFTIERGPKKYASDSGTLSLWMATTAGHIPTRCPLIALYGSRVVLGGARGSEHLAYQSKIGDPFDWNFASIIAGGAIAVGATPQGDQIATPLTAIVAFADDYLLYGCRNELYVQRGDLHFGGRIFNLSREVGVIARGAWCWGPNGEFLFLSRDGLYALAPGASSYPQRISRDVIPEELRNIDLENTVLSMSFDIQFGGVNIFVTPNDSPNIGTDWWFDWSNKGFWPMKFSSNHQAYATVGHDLLASSQRSALMGCRDGYVRTFDDAAFDDDGTAIESHVTVGPIMFGDGGEWAGALTSMQAKLGSNSGDIDWDVLADDDAELALIGDSKANGTFTAGHNARPPVRVYGHSGYLKLSSDASDRPWSFEQLILRLKMAGKLRVRA